MTQILKVYCFRGLVVNDRRLGCLLGPYIARYLKFHPHENSNQSGDVGKHFCVCVFTGKTDFQVPKHHSRKCINVRPLFGLYAVYLCRLLQMKTINEKRGVGWRGRVFVHINTQLNVYTAQVRGKLARPMQKPLKSFERRTMWKE